MLQCCLRGYERGGRLHSGEQFPERSQNRCLLLVLNGQEKAVLQRTVQISIQAHMWQPLAPNLRTARRGKVEILKGMDTPKELTGRADPVQFKF